MVTITQEEYDELIAADALLARVFSDHDLLEDYAEQYPELVKAAGYDEEDPDDLPFEPSPYTPPNPVPRREPAKIQQPPMPKPDVPIRHKPLPVSKHPIALTEDEAV
jgi:hypothetical protein